MKGRGTDAEDVIARRMAKAVNEMSHYNEYEYVIINDDFDEAFQQLQAIFVAMRTRMPLIREIHTDLINDLLS